MLSPNNLRPLCLLCLLFSGCSTLLTTGMDSHTLRTAIDNCKSNDLDVLAYQRPDGSIMAIRCIPKKSDVTKVITLRPRMPMPVIRLFSETFVMDE